MSNYKIFTSEYDQVRPISFYKNEILKQDPDVIDVWKSKKSKFAEYHSGSDIEITDPETPRTFLLDCSGSMRGHAVRILVSAMIELGDAMHEAGTPFEILGHTTLAWKGGRPHKDWIAQGRPTNPGRLNELLHLTIKERDESWPEARDNIFGLLHGGLLKENIDGEAISWAAKRMREHDQPGKMVIVSDGFPMDDATFSFSNSGLLEDHLLEVLNDERSNGIELDTVAIQNGYGRMKSAYPGAHIVSFSTPKNKAQSKNTAELIEQLQVAMAVNEQALNDGADAPSM